MKGIYHAKPPGPMVDFCAYIGGNHVLPCPWYFGSDGLPDPEGDRFQPDPCHVGPILVDDGPYGSFLSDHGADRTDPAFFDPSVGQSIHLAIHRADAVRLYLY